MVFNALTVATLGPVRVTDPPSVMFAALVMVQYHCEFTGASQGLAVLCYSCSSLLLPFIQGSKFYTVCHQIFLSSTMATMIFGLPTQAMRWGRARSDQGRHRTGWPFKRGRCHVP